MTIKSINSEEDYQEALKLINKLIYAKDGTPEAEELETISTLVADYEDEHYPIEPPTKFINASCRGEVCSICGKPAVTKISEEIFHDDPNQYKHPMTAYICQQHLDMIMGITNRGED